jgi:hypothetical protein
MAAARHRLKIEPVIPTSRAATPEKSAVLSRIAAPTMTRLLRFHSTKSGRGQAAAEAHGFHC